jgi:hypothetical protein
MRAGRLMELAVSERPGKEASFLSGHCPPRWTVRTTDVNTAPGTNSVATVTAFAHAGNVDTVLVAGQVRKWRGKLTGHDMNTIAAQVLASRDYLLAAVFRDLVRRRRDAAAPSPAAKACTCSKPSARSHISAPVKSRPSRPRPRSGARTLMPASCAVPAGRSRRKAAAASGGAVAGSVRSLRTSTPRRRIRSATSSRSTGTSCSSAATSRSPAGPARRTSRKGAAGVRARMVSTRPESPRRLGRDLASGQVTALPDAEPQRRSWY